MIKYNKDVEIIKELLLESGFNFSKDTNFNRDTLLNLSNRENPEIKEKLRKIIDNI